MLRKRASGVLLHITSLPGPHGIGDLGPAACKFLEFLTMCRLNYWQVLPLNHPGGPASASPYNCVSAFAGNPLLISPDLLYQDGLLNSDNLRNAPSFPADKVQYRRVHSYRMRLLSAAFESFRKRPLPNDFDTFLYENKFWLDDFCLFMALSREQKSFEWSKWPASLRNRRPAAMKSARNRLRREIEQQVFIQYMFRRHYSQLKYACEQKGVQLVGDIPIYVAGNSADVWAHPEVFKLDRSKKPEAVAGVPPDYFSKTGQLWGNPVYDWKHLVKTDFRWWIERIRHNLKLFDLVRIDHFRGLVAYWQVGAGEKTAINGKWMQTPSHEFFSALLRTFPFAPILAEDLGHITADVREVISQLSFPCMRVLQFGFTGDMGRNLHSPHNHVQNCVVYTGTHDNNTTRGWFETEATTQQKKCLSDCVGHKVTGAKVHWQMIRLAMSSVAKLAIIPMQDILGLDTKARMNYPAKIRGNWQWRMKENALRPDLADRLAEMARAYGRV